LTNVVRHAKARQVWLEYREQGQEVQLLIRDDGVGFDLSAVRDRAVRGTSFGMLGMQERVELLDGHIDIESKPMHGTTIRVRFPFTPASSDTTE
jgi:signal transduction histidine kinase